MSPASQGALEVEHYIGSYLISSSVRSPVGGKSLISGITEKQQEGVALRGKQQQQQQQQRDYSQQGNYLSKNEQCQYGTWAGAPLISMTSSQRRINQQSSPPPCQNQQQSVQSQQGQQIQTHIQNHSQLSRLAIHTQGAPLILADKFHNRGKIQSCSGINGIPMNNNGTNILNNVNGILTNYCNGNNVNNASGISESITTSTGRCDSARGQVLSEPVRKLQPQQQQQQQQSHQQLNSKTECANGKIDGGNIANIDSLSIASDESSGSHNSENSLPRIIKPRKRRKKDRKPTGSGVTISEITSKVDDHQQQNYQQQHQQVQQNIHQQHQNHPVDTGFAEKCRLKNMKNYAPICYEIRYEENRGHRRPQPIGKESYLHCQNQNAPCNDQIQHPNQQQMHLQQQNIADTRQQHHQLHHHQQQQPRYPQRNVQNKVLDHNKNVVMENPTSNMLVRSMALPSKETTASSNNYHIRNYRHHVDHPHHYRHHYSNDARSNNNNTAVAGNWKRGIINSIPRHRFSQQHQSHQQIQPRHDYKPMLMSCENNSPLVVGPTGTSNSADCQCRYCDPSGLIWNPDQSVYSLFLTPPRASEFPASTDYAVSHQQQSPHLPLFLSDGDSDISHQEQPDSTRCKYFELSECTSVASQRAHNHNYHHHSSSPRDSPCSENTGVTPCNPTTGDACNGHASSAVTMLRRSWSDPTSYFSEEISVPNRDVGVIGDRGQTEMTRGRSSWPGNSGTGLPSGSPGSSPYGNLTNLPASSQGLEVSTEIVTSPNGHRDLEIKFYSSSPSTLPAEDDKSAFLDDGEDFSDIWSYHESKLQQDFRTLLQAEE